LAESTKVIPVVPQEVAKPEAPPVPPPVPPMPVRAKPAQSSPAVTGDLPLGTIFAGFDTRADLTRFRKNRYGTFRVVNGKLSVTARPGHMATLTLENVEFHDGAVEVKTRHVSGAKRSAFGLEIRGNTTPDGRTHYYRFDTNGNVSYSIRKKTGRSSVALKGWSWIPRKDRREENTLRIECRGSMLRFLLNGITVGVFDDEAIRSGWIALYANAGMVVEFDDLRVEPSGG